MVFFIFVSAIIGCLAALLLCQLIRYDEGGKKKACIVCIALNVLAGVGLFFLGLNLNMADKEYVTYKAESYDSIDYNVVLTESRNVKNYLKATNSSLFNYHVDDETRDKYGLYEYPKYYSNDINADIFGYECSKEESAAIRNINGRYGEAKQFHVYVLFFDSQEVVAGEMQRYYWKGGHYNDFTVCLGHEGDSVTWCFPFSWSDSPALEQKTKMFFMENPHVDLVGFADFLDRNIDCWEPKDVENFSYLSNSLGVGPSLRLLCLLLLVDLLVVWRMVKNDRRKRSARKD